MQQLVRHIAITAYVENDLSYTEMIKELLCETAQPEVTELWLEVTHVLKQIEPLPAIQVREEVRRLEAILLARTIEPEVTEKQPRQQEPYEEAMYAKVLPIVELLPREK